MGRRKFPSSVKSSMHFDFPYPGEPGDGLRDEIGLLTWERVGDVKFVGTEEPNDEVVAGTPWRGYRCLQTGTGGYIKAADVQGVFSLSSGGSYEAELFVRPASSSSPGNIFSIRGEGGVLLTLGLDSDGTLTLTSAALGLNSASTLTLTPAAFCHVVLRLSGGTAYVYVDGALAITDAMTPSVTLDATEARLGGFTGQIDEFLFRHAAGAGAPAIPTQPYQGTLGVKSVGGFGDGAFGDVTINTANTQINTYAMINSIDSGTGKITIGAQSEGVYGAFAAGQELMIHVSHYKSSSKDLLGRWLFRRIAAIDGSEVTLDRPLSDDMQVTYATADLYWIQALTVPNYDNLTVTSAGVIVPRAWDTASGGGIVAFRCAGELLLSGGKIITSGKGVRNQEHGFKLSHAGILERFINSGNVFIAAESVTGTPDARIGNVTDGSLKGGAGGRPGSYGKKGSDGAVKAGGSGGDGFYSSGSGTGGEPNMGGAGSQPGGDKEYDPPNVILLAGTLALDVAVVSVGGYGGGGGAAASAGSSGGDQVSGQGAGGGAGGGGKGGDGPMEAGEAKMKGCGGGGGGMDGQGGDGGYLAGGDASLDGGGNGGGFGTSPTYEISYGGKNGGSGYGGGGGGGGHARTSYYRYGGGGGGGSDTGFAYIAAEILLAA